MESMSTNHIGSIFFMLLVSLSTIWSQYIPIENQILKDVEILTSGNSNVELNFTLNHNATILMFTLFPCFGSLDWYGGIHYPGNNPNNTCQNTWIPATSMSNCGPVFPKPPITFYFLMHGLSTYPSRPNISAVFDFIVYSSSDLLSELVPLPGNGGKLSASLTKAKTSDDPVDLTVSWTSTGNGNDTYSLWRWDSKADPQLSGFNPYTGCGVKSFMTLISPSVYSLSVSDSTYSAKLSSISRTDPFYLNVVVDRQGGYSAVYNPLIVNGLNCLVPSLFVLILASTFII